MYFKPLKYTSFYVYFIWKLLLGYKNRDNDTFNKFNTKKWQLLINNVTSIISKLRVRYWRIYTITQAYPKLVFLTLDSSTVNRETYSFGLISLPLKVRVFLVAPSVYEGPTPLSASFRRIPTAFTVTTSNYS